MVFKKRRTFKLEITQQKGSEMVVNFVASVANMKLSYISFFIVIMPNFFGVPSILFWVPPTHQCRTLVWYQVKAGRTRTKYSIIDRDATVCWVIWLTRNDRVFNNCQSKIFLHVFFRGTHSLWFWDLPQSALRNSRTTATRSKVDGVLHLPWMAFYFSYWILMLNTLYGVSQTLYSLRPKLQIFQESWRVVASQV